MPEIDRALSVTEPWATLIVGLPGSLGGPKDVENRTWSTDYRGTIAIHAPKRIDWDEFDLLAENGIRISREQLEARAGHIIGVARLWACSRRTSRFCSRWHEEGMTGWYLTDRLALSKPVACRGQLGLFSLPPDVAEAVGRQL